MRVINVFVLFLCFQASMQAQGNLLESLSLKSSILNQDVEYSVYLPHDYDHSKRNYPVLYLLHGYTDDETGWTQFGEVKKIADGLINNSDVTDMIIVMPDAGLKWYVNSQDGSFNYEDFFFQEFIPFIEKEYRIRARKEFRAISGLSMGGHGTIVYAMKHPDMFAAAAPLSAAMWSEQEIQDMPEADWNRYFGAIFGETDTEGSRLNEHLKSNIGYYLVRHVSTDELKQVKWYIDCGDDDFLIKGNMDLHSQMIDKGIPHEFRVRDGAHNWTYWRTALPEVLKFASASFHR